MAEEGELAPEQRVVANVGKMDARKHLAAAVSGAMGSNINQVGARPRARVAGSCTRDPRVGRARSARRGLIALQARMVIAAASEW